jgi:hypothetical protein
MVAKDSHGTHAPHQCPTSSENTTGERMRPRESLPFRKYLVLAVIIGVHVLFIELLFRNGRRSAKLPEPDEPRTLLYLYELPRSSAKPASERHALRRSIAPRARDAVSHESTPPEEPPAKRTAIDWYAEAEQVARATITASAEPKPRAFGEQPKCPFHKRKPRKPNVEWEPKPKKAGFMGPLPYVRLGKRCLVIPPLFGCALGELPAPKGASLEDIRDPDRPRSSVPDP